MAVLTRTREAKQGFAAAFLVSAALGCLPGVAGRRTLATGIDVSDVATLGLICVLLAVNHRTGWPQFSTRLGRWVSLWAFVFLVWWLVAFFSATTGLNAGPYSQAARTGRDFLYFAVLLPLFAGALSDRSFRDSIFLVLALVATYTAVLESVVRLGGPTLSAFVHSTQSYEESGLLRIYTDALDLVTFAFLFSLGAVLLSHSPGVRSFAAVVATTTFVDSILSLGRARYVGIAAGVLFATAVWWRVSSVGPRVLKYAGAITCILAVFLFLAPDSRPSVAVTGVGDRLSSTISDAEQPADASGNTIAYRFDVQRVMRQRLSDENAWITGLGFRSPSFDYDPDLPDGTIRNSDVGFYGALLTMGIVGVALIVVPLLISLWAASGKLRRVKPSDRWVLWASLASVAFCVSTAGSLVVLFNPTGVVVAALALSAAIPASPRSRHPGQRQIVNGPLGTSKPPSLNAHDA